MYVAILVAAAVGFLLAHNLPATSDVISHCGDVEMNPGPTTPLLDQDFLQRLQNKESNLSPLPFPIKNKHIYQKHELKKAGNFSWETVVDWLQVLILDFSIPWKSLQCCSLVWWVRVPPS